MRPCEVTLHAPRGVRVTGIGLGDLSPKALLGIEVFVGERVVYRLHGHVDGRGFTVAAGEMIDAMDRMAGRDHLTVDLGPEGVQAPALQVRLWLADGSTRPHCTAYWGAA